MFDQGTNSIHVKIVTERFPVVGLISGQGPQVLDVAPRTCGPIFASCFFVVVQ